MSLAFVVIAVVKADDAAKQLAMIDDDLGNDDYAKEDAVITAKIDAKVASCFNHFRWNRVP